MGRQPCCDKVGLKKGPWTADEDKKLINFILTNGQCCWRALPKLAGLLRCGKSCRLRWTNYLRPDLKRGLLSEDEENLVIELHSQLGNRWSKIASHLPGRTDNEIKNHWNTHIKKKLKKMGIDPLTHKPLAQPQVLQPIPNCGPSSSSQNNGSEFETSVQSSTITELAQQEDAEKSPISQLIDDFCTDEVPLIQPHEILPPSTSSPSTSLSSSSSSSTSDSSNITNPTNFNNNMIEKLEEQLPTTFDWQSDDQTTNNINMDNNMVFWDDDFMSSLDLLLNDDESQRDLLSVEIDELTHYSRMVLDEECFKYEQLL